MNIAVLKNGFMGKQISNNSSVKTDKTQPLNDREILELKYCIAKNFNNNCSRPMLKSLHKDINRLNKSLMKNLKGF